VPALLNGYEVSRLSVRSTFSEGPNLWDI
jgi:hypothetical protein